MFSTKGEGVTIVPTSTPASNITFTKTNQRGLAGEAALSKSYSQLFLVDQPQQMRGELPPAGV